MGMGKTLSLAALAMFLPGAAGAASPEESYLASRDAYVNSFRPRDGGGEGGEPSLAEHEAALRDLEGQLRRIVGTPSIDGVGREGAISLDTLTEGDVGFGLLDGLVFSSSDGDTRIVVTTVALFQAWLREHESWWEREENPPADPTAAFASEAFYTQAISTDARMVPFADLPVRKRAGANVAVAMLAGRSQDITSLIPSEIVAGLVRGDRVYVASVPAKAVAIAACDAVWSASEERARAALERYRASGDEKLLGASTRIQDDGAAAFHRCYRERAKEQAFFSALCTKAQQIVDRMPAPPER